MRVRNASPEVTILHSTSLAACASMVKVRFHHVAVRWIPRDCPCVVPGILSQAVKRAYRDATSEAPNWILIQVLVIAARMDDLEVSVDTDKKLLPRPYEGDESNAQGDH